MQVQALIDYFKLIAATHVEIESFGTGDKWEVAIAGEDIYPMLWLDQVFMANTSEPLETWEISFMVLAAQLHDESDENELLDLTHTIGQQIIQKIKNDDIYAIGASISAISFTNAFEDLLVGWRFELQLSQRIGVNRCNIDYAFNNRCNYAATITGVNNPFLNQITIAGGPLSMATLPADLSYEAGEPVPVINIPIQNELIALGYNATVLQANIPGQGPGGKGTAVQLVFNITGSLDEFQCLVGSVSPIMFTALCNCSYTASANNADIGSTLDIIKVNLVPLVLSSLPFDFTFSNLNFEADRAALEAELIALGYEATVVDTTPPAALGRTITITINNPPTGVVFNTMSGPVGFASFLYQCS